MDDQRDYAEEAYNRQMMHDEAIEEDAAQWQEWYESDTRSSYLRCDQGKDDPEPCDECEGAYGIHVATCTYLEVLKHLQNGTLFSHLSN